MLLLDVILDTSRIRIRPRVILRDSITAPADSTDSVASADVIGGSQQISDITPVPPKFLGMAGDDLSTMIWTVIIVLIALSLCFYLVRMYRHRL